MPAPHEIIAAPYTLYVGRVGLAFPRVDALEAEFVEAARWFKIGTSGTKNYEDSGVTVSHPQSLEYFRGAGSTAVRKAFRTEEDLLIGLTVVDLSPRQYAKALNDAVIRTVASATGIPGTQEFALQRGLEVATFAILIKGISTIDNTLSAQYQCETAIVEGSPAIAYAKGRPAGLELQYRAVDAAATGFGRLVVQAEIAR